MLAARYGAGGIDRHTWEIPRVAGYELGPVADIIPELLSPGAYLQTRHRDHYCIGVQSPLRKIRSSTAPPSKNTKHVLEHSMQVAAIT